MTDDTGNNIGYQGNPYVTTPHIDSLATEGVSLSNFHQMPMCTASRAGLMSGQYAEHTGAWRTRLGRTMMRGDVYTIAEAFRDNGYATGHYGKWHLGDNWPMAPQDQGFNDVVGLRCGRIGQSADYWGNDYFDDTVVVYLSDQGYWLGQHGFFDKRLILESSMRTPFMIRYPKLIKPGSVNTDLSVNIDIAPTLLEIAGAEIPAAMQGCSMLSLLRGEKVPDGRKAQWYSYWSNLNHHWIRTERYTYIKVPGHDVELYDRKIDPDQFNNIAADPENVDLLKNLEKQQQVKITEVGMTEEQLPKPNPTTDEINSRNNKKENDKRSRGTNEEGEPNTQEQKAIKRTTRRAKKIEQAKEEQS